MKSNVLVDVVANENVVKVSEKVNEGDVFKSW